MSAAQFGLGCYERFIAGEGDAWFGAALGVGRYLVEQQESDGCWLNSEPFVHTVPLRAPWPCAMAQGECASLLVRLYLETGDPAFAEVALKGLQPLSRPRDQAGTCAWLNGAPWPEEYPTDPPSFVLNGAIFAWWGVRDVGVGLGDTAASEAFTAGVDVLAANLHRFDIGWWSMYCLRRYPIHPIASSFYHALHITQLEAMQALAPRAEIEAVRQRWAGYFESAWSCRRALLEKVLFRLVVPRNHLLGNRLPWAHF
ncbi:MAG: D-glucuronyl C5-epimerase family protein [Actinomycetota bacterium]|nr:D-glucuronyl C5-epimerase family protein [Actinomycetota bacterium]